MANIQLKPENFLDWDIKEGILNQRDGYLNIGTSFVKMKVVAIKIEVATEFKESLLKILNSTNKKFSDHFIIQKMTEFFMNVYEEGYSETKYNLFLKKLQSFKTKQVNVYLKIYNLDLDVEKFDMPGFTLYNPVYFKQTYNSPFMYSSINDTSSVNMDNSIHTGIILKKLQIIQEDPKQIMQVISEKITSFLNLLYICLGNKNAIQKLDFCFTHNNVEYHLFNDDMVEIGSSYSSDNSTFVKGSTQLKTNIFFENNKHLFSLFNNISNKLYEKIFRAAMWLGKSLKNENLGDSFLQAAIALECLLTRNEKGYVIQPSITYSLCETLALLVGDTKEKRIDLFKDLRKLYGYRSAIVHSGQTEVTFQDYYNLFDAIKQGIYVILKLAEEQKWNNIEDIYTYVESLKFS
ncbi:MAG: hypothetical protein IJ564_00685 [Alphaproteobacteria bacterium]|nr:hypothetical protein [Alphaproteobacteria bacterium]